MDLFHEQEDRQRRSVQPLAMRMRPRSLDAYVGQQHLLGPQGPLRQLLASGSLASVILHGPPGCGKTTLAHLIAGESDAFFVSLHAAEAGVRDVRATSAAAHDRLLTSGRRTLLFLDEIHRFNRSQQDALLRDVEEGILILLGATTENPFVSINTPLLSRSHVFELLPLPPEAQRALLVAANGDRQHGLGAWELDLPDAAAERLIEMADGDARRLLNGLELAGRLVRLEQRQAITAEDVAAALQRKHVPYDASGDEHYDVTSALIKSVRGSDVDAALYWLARMLEGGEDPLFIARRLAILASEDIGNADPQALTLAASTLTITAQIGLPECQYALAQATVYLACASKSNAVTRAIAAARADVRENATLPVPGHLRSRPKRDARAPYRSPHDVPDGIVRQAYLGATRRYYNPTERGFEARIAERLRHLRNYLHGGDHGSQPDAD